MNFSKIKHPQTNELYSIFSKQGKALLRYYVKALQSGGSSEIIDGQGPNLPYTSEEENNVGSSSSSALSPRVLAAFQAAEREADAIIADLSSQLGIDNDTITRELGDPNTNTSSEEESEGENTDSEDEEEIILTPNEKLMATYIKNLSEQYMDIITGIIDSNRTISSSNERLRQLKQSRVDDDNDEKQTLEQMVEDIEQVIKDREKTKSEIRDIVLKMGDGLLEFIKQNDHAKEQIERILINEFHELENKEKIKGLAKKINSNTLIRMANKAQIG